jgi:hypothetical protein
MRSPNPLGLLATLPVSRTERNFCPCDRVRVSQNTPSQQTFTRPFPKCPNATPHMTTTPRRLVQTLCLLGLLSQQHTARSGAFSGGAAGGAAASALAGGLTSGTGATTPSSTAGAGGTSAAPEINNMVYDGMARLARDIAALTAKRLCNNGACDNTPILVEDPSSSAQIGVYQVVQSYSDELQQIHDDLELDFAIQTESAAPNFSKSNSLDFGTGSAPFSVTLSPGLPSSR